MEAFTTPGDALQSSASRLAKFVMELAEREPALVPYEVEAAASEALHASEHWTAARIASALAPRCNVVIHEFEHLGPAHPHDQPEAG